MGFFDFRVEVIVPAFTTLLANASWEVLCDEGPLLWTVQMNEFDEEVILIFRPRSFLALLNELIVEFVKRVRLLFGLDEMVFVNDLLPLFERLDDLLDILNILLGII